MTKRTVVALWATLAVAGSAAAVTVAVVASNDSGKTAAQGRNFNSGAATRLAGSEPPSMPATTPVPGPTSLPRTSAPASRARTAPPSSTARRTGDATPPSADRSGPGPVSISIPAIGVRAPVEPIGVDTAGEVAIPEDVRTVGWYRYSPDLPSQEGSTVLVGHVDSAEQGEGAFFTLRELSAGDRVLIRSAQGRVLTYRVISREMFPKTRVPLDALFSTTGTPRLTLITCGGSFDATIRSYRDNVVVTAVPA